METKIISFQEKYMERLYKEFYNAKGINNHPKFSFFKSDVVYLKKSKPFRLYKKSMCC